MPHNLNLPIPFGWFALEYSDELATGDVRPLYFFDEHLALFRTEDGVPHVVEAFCPHLGAHLGHGGQVTGNAIACPFHGWEFDGDGNCLKVPYARTMPRRLREGRCLYSFPVQERNRMIWAWYHPRRMPPVFELDDVPEMDDPNWSGLDRYEWEVKSHIQETGENAVDTAHFIRVHGAQDLPKADITLQGYRRETDLTMMTPSIDEDGNVDFARMEPMHLVTRNCGPGMSSQVFSRAFQTVMLGVMTPITASRMLMRFAFTKPLDASPQFKLLTDGLIAEIVRQVGQDIPIWENKAYRDAPILCDGDGPVAKYRRWFSQFYDQPTGEKPSEQAVTGRSLPGAGVAGEPNG